MMPVKLTSQGGGATVMRHHAYPPHPFSFTPHVVAAVDGVSVVISLFRGHP
jgi:hypothetical protein